MHLLITGILLGWGAAIPFGPINIEMIRRNLMFGFTAGWALGIGATTADTTYIILFECVAMLVKDLRPPWCKSTTIARQLISRDRPRHAQLRYLRITSYRVLK